MTGTDQRQSLRLVRHVPCALRAKPSVEAGEPATAPTAKPNVDDEFESLAKEFEGYCEQISDRAIANALRTLRRRVDLIQSTVATNVVQQAAWSQNQHSRRLSLSFDGLEVELLPSDQLQNEPVLLEVLFNLPALPPIVCTLEVTGFDSNRVFGPFHTIADADLRRLRRYLLLQDAASNQRQVG